MSPLSTIQVAERAGIHLRTLQRWVEEGRVKPRSIDIGKKTYLLWSEGEVQKVLQVKEKTYRKGRGRKRNAKKG
jgi:predicted site-specific integrase-resolvase